MIELQDDGISPEKLEWNLSVNDNMEACLNFNHQTNQSEFITLNCKFNNGTENICPDYFVTLDTDLDNLEHWKLTVMSQDVIEVKGSCSFLNPENESLYDYNFFKNLKPQNLIISYRI